MNIELKENDDLIAEIHVQLTPEDYQPNVEKTLKEYRKKVQVPGFRQGMAPMGHIQKMYGKQVKMQEVYDMANNNLIEYLDKKDIKYYVNPILDIDKSNFHTENENEGNFTYVYIVGLKRTPKIVLNKRNKITYHKILVADEVVDRLVKNYQNKHGKIQEVEIIEENNFLTCTMKQLDENNKEMEDGIVAENTLFYVKSIVDSEIKDMFIGKEINSIIVFNPRKAFKYVNQIAEILRIEAEDAKNLDCNFECTVTSTRKIIPAELNETLFSNVFPNLGITTVEQFKENIRKDVEKEYESVARHYFTSRIREYMLNKFNVQLPESILKTWCLNKYESLTSENLEANWESICNETKWKVIVTEIASLYDIKVTEEDIMETAKEEVKSYFQYHGFANISEEYSSQIAEKRLEKEKESDRLTVKILEYKVINKIIELIDVDEVYLSYEEFVKLK